MKIAVCLSGHMRKFRDTFPSINVHLLSRYNCDVFIHTWDKMGYSSAFKTDNTQDNTQSYVSIIQQLYKPKKMIVEESSFVEELKAQGNIYAPHLRNEPKHVGHMASMFYKIYAVNELRNQYQLETGTQYDWVVRARTDLTFHAPVHMPSQKVPGKIYLSKQQSNPGWLSDQFAIALPDDMNLYSSFFFHMKEYFENRNEFYPEKFMVWSMAKKKLSPDFLDFQFSILR